MTRVEHACCRLTWAYIFLDVVLEYVVTTQVVNVQLNHDGRVGDDHTLYAGVDMHRLSHSSEMGVCEKESCRHTMLYVSGYSRPSL